MLQGISAFAQEQIFTQDFDSAFFYLVRSHRHKQTIAMYDSQDSVNITFKTYSIDKIVFDKDAIISAEKAFNSKLAVKAYLNPVPDYSHYSFTQSGFNMQPVSVKLGTIIPNFYTVDVGISKYVSMGTAFDISNATDIWQFSDLKAYVYWKRGNNVNDWLKIGTSLYAMKLRYEDSKLAFLPYLCVTAGTINYNMSVGLSWEIVSDYIFEGRITSLNAILRVSRVVSLVTENWYCINGTGDYVCSQGIKFYGQKFGFNVLLLERRLNHHKNIIPYFGIYYVL